MQLLISDTNILIDLEEGRLLEAVFRLPYRFAVPDILFYEELEEQHTHLLGMGLMINELTSDSMLYALELSTRVTGPSRNDCFALALARQEQCPLLSGDRALRTLASQEAVVVMGTIWLVEQMVQQKIISIQVAQDAYESMRVNGRRLPWGRAIQGLTALATGL